MSHDDASYGTLRPLASTTEFADKDLANGARLLGQVGPLSRSEHRKRRVWNALNLGTRAPLLFRLRAWHFATAGLFITAASSAAVGTYYVAHTQGAQVELAAAPPVAAPATPPVRHARRPHPVVAAAPTAPDEAPSEPLADATPPAHVAPRSKAVDPSPHAKRAQSEAEAELLVEAMRARRAGDSRRVSELVDEYRAKHPNGSLQEEALILSIESAVSRHAPNAAALSREYLTRFPNGRFAAQAKRAAGTGPR